MIITYQEIMDCGAWEKFCSLHGASVWAVSEGGGGCQASLTIDQAHHLGIVKQTEWKRKPFSEIYPSNANEGK